MWPAWQWTHSPWWRFLTASYASVLAKRDAVKTRRLIMSPWYQRLFGSVFTIRDDQNEKTRYENSRTGFRIATSVGGAATGDGGDATILDDPLKASDAHSDLALRNANEWIDETWSTRFEDPANAREVVIMQRLNERDVSGHLLQDVGGYEHLMLPMEFDPDRRCSTSIGFVDPRTKAGELLDSERHPREAIETSKTRLGSYGTAGQLQQNPTPAGGGVVKEYWLRFWYPPDAPPPTPHTVRLEDGSVWECPQTARPELTDLTQSWDMNFGDEVMTKKQRNTLDPVCGLVFGANRANHFLLDYHLKVLDFTETQAAVRRMSAAWPKAKTKLIEKKANGAAIISSMRDELGGVIGFDPGRAGKEARLYAVTPTIEAGNFYIPHPTLFPWVREYIGYLTGFPRARYDDPVDATTQYLLRKKRRGALRINPAATSQGAVNDAG